jgi:long-subunit acyl-CoA synthetase (AMP-forming)/3-oxoacyl-(acyl-carrier-protein) synthase
MSERTMSERTNPELAIPIPSTLRGLLDGFDPSKRHLVAFEQAQGDTFADITYGDVQDRARAVGNGLLDLGVRKGDRVGILAENRYEWPVTYLGATAVGATVAALDIFFTPDEAAKVLRLSAPTVIFTSAKFLKRIGPVLGDLDGLRQVVCFDDHEANGTDGQVHWQTLCDRGQALSDAGSDHYAAASVDPEDIAAIIFLSTTLGVNMSHRAIMANQEGFLPLMTLEGSVGKRWISILPFHHAWPTVVGFLYPLLTFATNTILASTKLELVLETIRARRIHFVMIVPVLVERLYELIGQQARQAGVFAGLDPDPSTSLPDRFDRALREPGRRRLINATLERMGLTGMDCIFSAGAHLFLNQAAKFKALGLDVINNYGLTETTPIISHSTPSVQRMGSAGKVIHKVEIRIDQPDRYGNGEICARGPVLFSGYYNAPEATAAVHDADGWLHTGDVGMVDADGFLYVTGRCKPMIVTQGGKNVYPKEIEAAIIQSPFIDQVVLTPKIVDEREFPYALIHPDWEAVRAHEQGQSQEHGQRLDDAGVRKLLQAELQATTGAIASYKLPEDFEVVYGPIDIQEVRGRELRFESPQSREGDADANATASASASPDVTDPILEGAIAHYLLQEIARTLDKATHDIDLEVSFFSYLASPDIVEVSARMESQVGIKLYPPMLFEHIDIPSLAGYFAKEFRAEFTAYLGEDRLAAAAAQSLALAQTRAQAATDGEDDTSLDALRSHRTARGETHDDIAIIGMAGVFPGSEDLDAFWAHLVAGDDLITEIPKDRFDWEAYQGDPLYEANKMNTRWGGFINDVDKFDASFFGIRPKEARSMDPQQRMFMETAWKALEDAGVPPSGLAGHQVGVFAGVTAYDYMELVRQAQSEVSIYAYSGTFPSVLPHRISYLLGLHGPSEMVDTACSSALVALHRARRSLLAGECDLAIAGGVSALLSPELFLSFSKAGMLSPEGRCKTFSANADGYVRGEGVGAVVLKPLTAALADDDPIHAVIRSSAVNHGGRASSFTSPNPTAQARVLVTAYEEAGMDPATVSYIEAHGTGTSLGDPIEINGLKKGFAELYARAGRPAPSVPHCGLGSVKTNIGHLEAAAGIAGLIKLVLCLRHGELPSNLHCQEVSPYVDLENSPFYLVNERQPWQRLTDTDTESDKDSHDREIPRRAGVSSFGVGGANAHVVLEEYRPVDGDSAQPPNTASSPAASPQLFVLSARNADRLHAYADRMATFLDTRGDTLSLANVAYTSQVGRDEMSERLALVATTIDELKDKLKAYAAGEDVPAVTAGTAQNTQDLVALGQTWVKGDAVDWKQLHGDLPPRRISLPSYPFTRKRYWVK